MNDIYYNLIILIIIIVLFLSLILIAYFYNSYTNNKIVIKNNLYETKDYVNDTSRILDENIRASYQDNNKRIDKLDDKYKVINKDLQTNINTNTTEINKLKTSIDASSNNINKTLNNFDNGLKQYFDFKSSGSRISDSIFNYTFAPVPNLSIDLIRNVTALSGMTVMSDVTTNNNFKICDTDNSKKNCIDMSITKEGVFNIAPIADFGDKVNNINTINILNKDNKKLLNIDLKTENIFLGGDKDEAGMMIHNDKVFVKKLNLLHPNKNFTDDKFYANKNTYLQNANEVNTYEFDIMDTKYQKDVLINIPCNYWIETEVKTTTPPSGTDTSTIREIKKIIIQLRIDNYTFFPLGLNAGTIIRIPIYHLAVPTTDIKNDGLVNLDINMRSKVKLSFEGLVQGKQNIIICETLTNIDYLDVLNIVLENTNNIFALDKKYDNIEPLFSTFNAYIVNM
jgi:hypothetical protein